MQGYPEFLGQLSDDKKLKMNPRTVFKRMTSLTICASFRMQCLDSEDDICVCPWMDNLYLSTWLDYGLDVAVELFFRCD